MCLYRKLILTRCTPFILCIISRHSRYCIYFFFFSSRRRHTRLQGDWSSDVCSSDLPAHPPRRPLHAHGLHGHPADRKSTRLNSSHLVISYAVFCLKKKKQSLFQKS